MVNIQLLENFDFNINAGLRCTKRVDFNDSITGMITCQATEVAMVPLRANSHGKVIDMSLILLGKLVAISINCLPTIGDGTAKSLLETNWRK